jgi:hypothetical protein
MQVPIGTVRDSTGNLLSLVVSHQWQIFFQNLISEIDTSDDARITALEGSDAAQDISIGNLVTADASQVARLKEIRFLGAFSWAQ